MNSSGTDSSFENDRRLIRLDSRDNVLTVAAPIAAGERFRVAGRFVTAADELPLGHKVAAGPIASGEQVIKYGVPIGSVTTFIALGEHVHTHNLKSDYLPTYSLETQTAYFERNE